MGQRRKYQRERRQRGFKAIKKQKEHKERSAKIAHKLAVTAHSLNKHCSEEQHDGQ